MAHDVFISHDAADAVVANAVCARLESAGIGCWIAPRDQTPGVRYSRQIIEAIDASVIVLLVLSEHSNDSPAVLNEIEAAARRRIAVVPMRTDDVVLSYDLEYYIQGTHWFEAKTAPLEAHLDELVRRLHGLLSSHGAQSDATKGVLQSGPHRKFAIDVFLSFAEHDNEPVGSEEFGWVDDFRKELVDHLSMRLGRPANVWSRRNSDSGADPAETEDALRRSAVFVYIMSPSYVQSEQCRLELRLFVEFLTASVESINGGKESRVTKIILDPVKGDNDRVLPGNMQMKRYSFYEANELGYYPLVPWEDHNEYYGTIRRLTDDLSESITNLNG